MCRLVAVGEAGLFRIIYDSIVMLPFGAAGERELDDLVQASRQRNERDGITGVLRYDGAYFLQVLEGPRAAVEAAMRRILRDPRHTDVHVIDSSPIPHRDFADWSMALVTDAHIDQARQRHADLLDVRPFRAAEVVHTLRSVLQPG